MLKVSSLNFYDFPDNSFDKVNILEIAKIIEKIKSFKPDTIFTHFENDLNIDHQKLIKQH